MTNQEVRMQTDTRTVARFYADAWTQGDPASVRQIIAPDAEIEWNLDAPVDDEQLVQTLDRIATCSRTVVLVSENYTGDRAALVYDCAAVFGVVRLAEFLVVGEGRITEVRQVYDATAVRQFFPALIDE
jgi:ketosteroid isomerase-like protein